MTALAELSHDACLARIAAAEVARVAVSTPMGPRILPVNYVFDGQHIVFRTTPYSVLGTYAHNAEVAVEMGHLTEDFTDGWSVLVVGRAEMVHDAAELTRIREEHDPTPWAAGPRRMLYVRVPLREVTGQQLVELGAPATEQLIG